MFIYVDKTLYLGELPPISADSSVQLFSLQASLRPDAQDHVPVSALGCYGAQHGPNRKWSLNMTFPGNSSLKKNVVRIRCFPLK